MKHLTYTVEVESTNLKTVRYDSTFRLMVIEFQSGSIYGYNDVSIPEALGMLNADSAGSYFNAAIKKKPFQKVK